MTRNKKHLIYCVDGKHRYMTYHQYIQSPEWVAKAQRIKRMDGYRCQTCHRRNKLTVHHVTYARLGKERNDDLITLCWPCHKSQHLDKGR